VSYAENGQRTSEGGCAENSRLIAFVLTAWPIVVIAIALVASLGQRWIETPDARGVLDSPPLVERRNRNPGVYGAARPLHQMTFRQLIR
jgi:hypothetical protein